MSKAKSEAPSDASVVALIGLLREIEHTLRARENPAMAQMYAQHTDLIKASLVGMPSKRLRSVFKDLSELLFTVSNADYAAAMKVIKDHGLESEFTSLIHSRYTRVLQRVLKRGAIRTSTEAHAVKTAVDDNAAPGLEVQAVQQLSEIYERFIAGH